MRRGKIVLILLLARHCLLFLPGVLIWGIRAGQGDFGESLRRSFSLGRGERTREVDLAGIREIRLDYGSVDLQFSRGGRQPDGADGNLFRGSQGGEFCPDPAG